MVRVLLFWENISGHVTGLGVRSQIWISVNFEMSDGMVVLAGTFRDVFKERVLEGE